MITGTLIGSKELIAKLGKLPDAIKAEVDKTMQRLGFQLEQHVKADYLRGPRPEHLGVVTRRLSDSITLGAADSRTRFVSTETTATYYVGTNVPYGADWENGFDRRVGAGARGGPRNLSPAAAIRYLAKHPPGTKHYGSRPFLEPALTDLRPMIVQQFQMALNAAAKEAMR